MYSSFQLSKKYIQYYRKAANSKGHGVHSPFVFDFIKNVLNNGKNYQSPQAIEILRSRLLKNHQLITVTDLGAGSRKENITEKKISRIAATALKSPKYAQLMYRLVRHYKPQRIIELGTSLGITTAYLSNANPVAKISTIEGSEAILALARENLASLNCGNIQFLHGNFDLVLPQLLAGETTIDLAYIDGNHRYQPTISYFHQLLEKTHGGTIMVFDDIHWSREMEAAWTEIRRHPSVQYSIDIFFLGFVFFRSGFKVKQDFDIRF